MQSVMEFVKSSVEKKDIEGKHIIEIGSMDVNGSIKPLIIACNPRSYLGVDIRYGRNVDLVWNAEELDLLPLGEFDYVFCTETLEHVLNWKKAVYNLKKLTKTNGKLLVTTVSNGFPLHEYPNDYWRFELEDFRKIFGDFENTLFLFNNQLPGVFFRGTKTNRTVNLNYLNDITVCGLEFDHHVDDRFVP